MLNDLFKKNTYRQIKIGRKGFFFFSEIQIYCEKNWSNNFILAENILYLKLPVMSKIASRLIRPSYEQCFFFCTWKSWKCAWKNLVFFAWKCEPFREKILKSVREKAIFCVKISSNLHTWNLKKCTWKKDNIPSVKTTESWKSVRENNLKWKYSDFPLRHNISSWIQNDRYRVYYY